MDAVQGLHVGVKLGAASHQVGKGAVSLGRLGRLRHVQRLLYLRVEPGLLGLVGMQLQAERRQPRAVEASLHHVERRLLLGYEQDSAALGQIVRDDVRDRLRLAGAGRPVQHERLARLGIQHRRELRRIAADRAEEIARLSVARHFIDREDFHAVVEVPSASSQMVHEAVAAQLSGLGGQLTPHHELAEREAAERGFLHDAPPLAALHALAEGAKHARHVHAGRVRRQGLQSVRDDAELRPQELQQRRVHRRLFVQAAELHAVRHR